MRKLNIHVIAKQLNKLCQELANNYCINFGGCCYVAYEIARHFDRLGLKYELKIYDNCGKNLEAINREVREKHQNCSDSESVVGIYSCSHYFLWLKGAGAINEESEFFDGWKAFSISNIDHTNIRWIYQVGSWNDEYDTEHNQTIKKIINSYFKPYEQSLSSKVRKGKNGKMS